MNEVSGDFKIMNAGYVNKQARIVITHPLGLYMNFEASQHNAMKLVEFGQECIRSLENKHATKDWSI